MWPRALTAAKRKEVAYHQDTLYAVWSDKLQLWITVLLVSTLQRHLKCFQLSTWFGKLWGSLWDLGSDFLGMCLKPAWGREPSKTRSADHTSGLWGEGLSGSRGSGGVCLAVGCPCDCEGLLSAGEIRRGAEFIQSPQKM